MIPGKTIKLAAADPETDLVNCIAIQAIGGEATFTTLEEGGAASDLAGETLAEGETWYSWKSNFNKVEIATGTINAYTR